MFQLYKFSDDSPVWWRLVSPNGRGLARSATSHPSVASARSSLDLVLASVDSLELGLRLTPTYRWHWSLQLDGTPVAEGIGDQDRRVRCMDAGRKFQLLSRVAPVEPDVIVFRRETVSPRAGGPSRAAAQNVTRS
ncbi:hypothetical protein ACPPVS_01720 [Cellulomonas sp. McL0617]|uniref:hypothetical protein n=1 Tax=Cellulomonas sp. McL0617 TaxID=3415675 RepID=UPI003CF59C18